MIISEITVSVTRLNCHGISSNNMLEFLKEGASHLTEKQQICDTERIVTQEMSFLTITALKCVWDTVSRGLRYHLIERHLK